VRIATGAMVTDSWVFPRESWVGVRRQRQKYISS